MSKLPVPLECIPCRYCDTVCMYMESDATEGDPRLMVRIGSGCARSIGLEKDSTRTEFGPEVVAVEEWNRMNRIV
jgi:hypothetical protein